MKEQELKHAVNVAYETYAAYYCNGKAPREITLEDKNKAGEHLVEMIKAIKADIDMHLCEHCGSEGVAYDMSNFADDIRCRFRGEWNACERAFEERALAYDFDMFVRGREKRDFDMCASYYSHDGYAHYVSIYGEIQLAFWYRERLSDMMNNGEVYDEMWEQIAEAFDVEYEREEEEDDDENEES